MRRGLVIVTAVVATLEMLAACARGAEPPIAEPGADWLDRLPGPPDAEPMDADLRGVSCHDNDAGAVPCARVQRRGRLHHVNPNEIPNLEAMLATLPESSAEHAAVLRRLTFDYLELACLAQRECVRDILSPPKLDPQAARGAARIAREAEAKHRVSCERLRQRNDPQVTEICEPQPDSPADAAR